MIINLDGRQIKIRDDQAKAYEDTMMQPISDMQYTYINIHSPSGYDNAIKNCSDDELRLYLLTGMKTEIELYGGIFPK